MDSLNIGDKPIKELRKSDDRFHVLFNSITDAVLVHWVETDDTRGTFIEVNDVACHLLGYTREELLGMTPSDIDEPDSDVDVASITKRLEFGKNVLFEQTHVSKDGRRIPVEINSRVFTIAGRPAVMSLVRDISERKMADEVLHRTQFAVNTSRDAVFLVRRDAGLAYVNAAACQSLGYTKEELLSLTVFDFDPEIPREKWDHDWEQNSHVESYLIETMHLTKNGHRFPVEIAINPIRFGGEEYRFAYARDITVRKEAELLLKESELKFRTVVKNAQAIIFILDDNGVFLLSEGQALAKIGLQPGQVVGMSAFELYRDNPEVLEAVRKALNGELTRITNEVHEVVLDVVCSPYCNASGNRSGVIGIAIDITDRIRAEEEKNALQAQLLQVQKMESVARLAGGVAHDFNNMLSAILGHAELAMMQCTSSEPINTHLKSIEKSALRSAELIRQLLAFARRQTVAPKVLDLNDRVAGTLKMLRPLVDEDVDLVWMPGAGLWPVKIDPSQIDQLLANLCVNARDAISGVGKVTIETDNAAFDEAYCAVHPGFICGEYVMLAVSDDGCGMSKEVLDHLFEPFFTTKEVGKGTGLGLATVHGIVKQNDGFINIYSEPYKGSTFKIYLPRFIGEARELKGESTVEVPKGNGETVLLVEDETVILNVGKEMLEGLGYTVLTAGTPEEALRHAKAHVAEIDLLITDVIMPEMNGLDLANLISDIKPRLRCLFVSGYTADLIAHHGMLNEDVCFLQKPFSIRGLASKVRESLEQK